MSYELQVMSDKLRVSSEYLYGKGIPGGVSLTFFVGKGEFNNLNKPNKFNQEIHYAAINF